MHKESMSMDSQVGSRDLITTTQMWSKTLHTLHPTHTKWDAQNYKGNKQWWEEWSPKPHRPGFGCGAMHEVWRVSE